MPTYNFKNKKTKKKCVLEMKISDLDAFLAEHPELEQLPPDSLNIGDSVRLGITKAPADFQKYVLGRIKSSVPGARGIGTKFPIPKEV